MSCPGYRLRIEADAVDASRFRSLTARAHENADPRVRARLLPDALALRRGPAFADFASYVPFAGLIPGEKHRGDRTSMPPGR